MKKEEIDKNTVLLIQLVLTFQSAAMQQMGKLANVATGKIERNLEQASHSIDTIDMLCTKCKGNLTDYEEKFISHVISELKLNYVDECRKPGVSKDETQQTEPTTESSEKPDDSSQKKDQPD